ncbi:ASCH domain-containing protein [Microbacterium sp. SL75]|uniref:ASCH domain-containing protein n=1 Tax=Microbacterium sp. SL75 TaxID=2995140 RepID=UPI00226DFF76|nr:ASCH domain-containing protein [Microbacterium sp. SL75]WAC67793.1 ASCH domain-containing protein [Microbacterium sp. SL75]
MTGDLPPIEFMFTGAGRDRIVAAIRAGEKTATSSLVREYLVAGEPLPAVGDRGAVVDSAGEPVCVIETTAVEIVALRDVSLAHALDEGEGYASVADWRRGHVRFWTSDAMREELGSAFVVDDDTSVVLERFAVVG